MTERVDPPWQAGCVEQAHRAQAAAIAKELAAIARTGQVLPGSLAERRVRCGRPNCACHADEPKLHGPYWRWTRKVANKTVGHFFTQDQAEEYSSWIDNGRRLRELLSRLEALGASAAEADERTPRRARPVD